MGEGRLSVGVVLGGMSAEHEVSWHSARNILRALDEERYRPVPILLERSGRWFLLTREEVDSDALLHAREPRSLPGERRVLLDGEGEGLHLVGARDGRRIERLDVVFPALHGPYGEDGALQGLCRIHQVPFVGPGVLCSAVCMDKVVMKRLLREQGIPVAAYLVFEETTTARADMETAPKTLGFPLFVKPANLGSSVGIRKVDSLPGLEEALAEAWRFDPKAIVEEFVEGREIECSVLGNDEPIASLPGEVIPRHEFYSYEAKYDDPAGAELRVPADLPPEVTERIRELALRSFTALGGEGMARVDFFLRPDGGILVNELNTIPGFTDISMYPKLWEASGLPCRELVHRLIQLGLERFKREAGLERDGGGGAGRKG